MCDMEKLYRHLQKKCQYPAAYKNGQITVTLSRGEVRIREKCAQLLLQDRLYEEFDWDETDDPDDLVKIVDNFAENLEFMGSEYNATYKAANKAAVRRCWWIPLLMLVVAMASLAMMDRTEDVYWLLAILVCPFFLLVPLVAIRRSVFHRYWVCPQCGQPLPLSKGKWFPQMEYTARCPHCGYFLEEFFPVEALLDEDSERLRPDPAHLSRATHEMISALSALLEKNEVLKAPVYGTLLWKGHYSFGYFGLTDTALLVALLRGDTKKLNVCGRIALSSIQRMKIRRSLFPLFRILHLELAEEKIKIRFSSKVVGFSTQGKNLNDFLVTIRSVL